VRAGREAPDYAEAPAGLRVGHIHLRVGSVETAEAFYGGPVGLALTRKRGGAAFLSSARYHHHVAANVWHSNGAGQRDKNRAGLAWFEIAGNDAATLDAARERLRAAGAPVAALRAGFETADPWGTRIRFVPA
jgi:catechol 2,3-dioxygenase